MANDNTDELARLKAKLQQLQEENKRLKKTHAELKRAQRHDYAPVEKVQRLEKTVEILQEAISKLPKDSREASK